MIWIFSCKLMPRGLLLYNFQETGNVVRLLHIILAGNRDRTGCVQVLFRYLNGWADMKMIAHCGLDCSTCEGYIATQAEDAEGLAKVAAKWSAQFDAEMQPEDVICDGCRVDGRKSTHCGTMCEIRRCCLLRKFETCIECGEFPCEDEEFVLRHAPWARENLAGGKK